MSRSVVSTPHAPGALGPYSQAIKANGVLYLSGSIGIDPRTNDLVGPGVAEQAEQARTPRPGVLFALTSARR
jgi:enamine deaminase RidA (YjgF/YER057c/UK114 family)